MHQLLRTRVNDFALKLANVNGTGSASANGLLMQAIFRMGIPVSGKNLFPSNIQGLPTWYEIRVNKDGHTARALDYDLMVAMNSQTYARDVAEVREGGYLFYDSSWPLDASLAREDITFLGVPLSKMCNETFKDPRERILMKNIAYAGSLVALLGVDMGIVELLLNEKFAAKKALHESNHRALRLGYDYAQKHFECPLPFRLEKMDANSDKILIDGNTAAALGCVYAGATVAAWYPITPSTSVMDAFKEFCEKYRKDPETGENNFLILQAEDELGGHRHGDWRFVDGRARVHLYIWPGHFAHGRAVGTGVLCRDSSGRHRRSARGAVHRNAHADAAGRPAEGRLCLARRHQTHPDFPGQSGRVFRIRSQGVRSGGALPDPGVHDAGSGHRHERLGGAATEVGPKLPPGPRPCFDRRATREDCEIFRYSPEDENYVAARTLPGVHAKGAFFTRGSGHNKLGGYTEIPDEYQEVIDRLLRKHKAAARFVPEPIIERRAGARIGIVTIGGCDLAVREAVEILAARGVETDFMRIRGFPFDETVENFIMEHDVCYIVEQNRDAQLRSLLLLETAVTKDKMRSVLVYGGFPLSARPVVDEIMSQIDDIAHGVTAAVDRTPHPVVREGVEE